MTESTAPFTLSNPAGLYDPAPNHYSHLATVAAGTRLVCAAGQGGETADGALVGDFAGQLRQAFANVSLALAGGGARAADVFKLVVLVVDHDAEKLRQFGIALDAWHHGMKPACTLIPVPRLALDGMLVEIEATAAIAA